MQNYLHATTEHDVLKYIYPKKLSSGNKIVLFQTINL